MVEPSPSSVPSPEHALGPRHLLDLSSYTADDLLHILETARNVRSVLHVPSGTTPALQGTSIATLFFEPSTRTKLSFDLAASRLSAETVSLSPSGSSVQKGETLKDTARTIEAMNVDVIVLRHPSPGAPHFLARQTDSVIINAGDGAHAHPTQALLDALTMQAHVEAFDALHLSIVGDIAHSRVARSNIRALSTLGATVTVCGPPTLLPPNIETALDVRATTQLTEALADCDIAMALRIQTERQDEGLVPSTREYHQQYGITEDHLEQHPELRIMHPGPVNRGIELTSEVVDHERSIILSQVTNGVALRMALLYLLSPREDGT